MESRILLLFFGTQNSPIIISFWDSYSSFHHWKLFHMGSCVLLTSLHLLIIFKAFHYFLTLQDDLHHLADFPCGSSGKESACNVEDLGSIPGLERSPGKGKGYPLQFSGLENSMHYSPGGCKESDMTEQLSLSLFHPSFMKGALVSLVREIQSIQALVVLHADVVALFLGLPSRKSSNYSCMLKHAHTQTGL